MICWKCKTKLEKKKIGFRAICETCGYDFHVCKNCKYFLIGKPNDCLIPNTEPISDREKYNFCEDFVFSDSVLEEQKSNKKNISKHLFKDHDKDDDDDTKSFDSLFKN